MSYTISFNFESGQTFDVIVSQQELQRFLTTTSKCEVYWDKVGGLWIALNKVLFFTVKENKNEVESGQSAAKQSGRMAEESSNPN